MASQEGFTLVELVTVMMLIAVLAAVVVPRLTGSQFFDELRFMGQVESALRFAQKSAIAKRRLVCVAFAADSVMLRYASSAGAASCDSDLTGPTGETAPFTVRAPAGITLSPVPADFDFNSLGRPSGVRVVAFSGGSGKQITVEAETGYVHSD